MCKQRRLLAFLRRKTPIIPTEGRGLGGGCSSESDTCQDSRITKPGESWQVNGLHWCQFMGGGEKIALRHYEDCGRVTADLKGREIKGIESSVWRSCCVWTDAACRWELLCFSYIKKVIFDTWNPGARLQKCRWQNQITPFIQVHVGKKKINRRSSWKCRCLIHNNSRPDWNQPLNSNVSFCFYRPYQFSCRLIPINTSLSSQSKLSTPRWERK